MTLAERLAEAFGVELERRTVRGVEDVPIYPDGDAIALIVEILAAGDDLLREGRSPQLLLSESDLGAIKWALERAMGRPIT